MPHLDYLTYLSQIFWFLLFFWLGYFLFFFVFFPKLYYSFRIRKLKFDFLFDKYTSTEYKIHFCNFFLKDYAEKFRFMSTNYLKFLKGKYKIHALSLKKRVKAFIFFANLYFNEVLCFYWSKGLVLNFSSFLNATFFFEEKKSLFLIKSVLSFKE